MVTRRFTFDAAHDLPFHPGKCRRLHGHTYRLAVSVRAELDEQGLALDFADVKAAVREHVLSVCDHAYLNDLFPFPTTAENLARHFFEELRPRLPGLCRIELWETEECGAAVTPEDFGGGT